MTAGQPPSPSVTSKRNIDWILIPAICEAAAVAKGPGIAILPASAVDIISPSPQRQRRPWSGFGPELSLLCKDQGTQTVDLVKDGRLASTGIPQQTPPSRPLPRRLLTPDLPDLDEEEFWPSWDQLEKCHKTVKGSDRKEVKTL
ncbi:hypothetical protein MMC18_001880 [Xylographa bjoerkii]|nr:hypothetical protein [Xylographa bjoerkii]